MNDSNCHSRSLPTRDGVLHNVDRAHLPLVAWYRNQQHCPSINNASTRARVTCLPVAHGSQGSGCSLVLYIFAGGCRRAMHPIRRVKACTFTTTNMDVSSIMKVSLQKTHTYSWNLYTPFCLLLVAEA